MWKEINGGNLVQQMRAMVEVDTKITLDNESLPPYAILSHIVAALTLLTWVVIHLYSWAFFYFLHEKKSSSVPGKKKPTKWILFTVQSTVEKILFPIVFLLFALDIITCEYGDKYDIATAASVFVIGLVLLIVKSVYLVIHVLNTTNHVSIFRSHYSDTSLFIMNVLGLNIIYTTHVIVFHLVLENVFVLVMATEGVGQISTEVLTAIYLSACLVYVILAFILDFWTVQINSLITIPYFAHIIIMAGLFTTNDGRFDNITIQIIYGVVAAVTALLFTVRSVVSAYKAGNRLCALNMTAKQK